MMSGIAPYMLDLLQTSILAKYAPAPKSGCRRSPGKRQASNNGAAFLAIAGLGSRRGAMPALHAGTGLPLMRMLIDRVVERRQPRPLQLHQASIRFGRLLSSLHSATSGVRASPSRVALAGPDFRQSFRRAAYHL